MYIKILKNFILGYVNITIEGFYIEKFINACIRKRIFFWSTIRSKSTIFSANIGINDFKEVSRISKGCQCKIKINDKKGIPFILNKYRKRKFFAVTLIVIIIAIITVYNFIWNIEITGIEDQYIKTEILELIKNEGVEIGKYKKKINLQNLINKIRIERNDIAWIGMDIKGTNLHIKVVKSDEKPEIVDKNDYCNIIAKKDGVVTKVLAQNGTPIVKEGDMVKKGDILIKGLIEGKYTDSRLVHSEGDVIAKVWYSETEKVYYNQIIQNQTGNNEKKYTIKVNNFQINLFKTLSKFENYDIIKTVKKLKITSDFYLPIEVIINKNQEKQNNTISYSKEEAKEIGINNAKNRLNNIINNQNNMSNIYINTNENSEYIEVEVIYEVLESIGTKEKIIE